MLLFCSQRLFFLHPHKLKPDCTLPHSEYFYLDMTRPRSKGEIELLLVIKIIPKFKSFCLNAYCFNCWCWVQYWKQAQPHYCAWLEVASAGRCVERDSSIDTGYFNISPKQSSLLCPKVGTPTSVWPLPYSLTGTDVRSPLEWPGSPGSLSPGRCHECHGDTSVMMVTCLGLRMTVRVRLHTPAQLNIDWLPPPAADCWSAGFVMCLAPPHWSEKLLVVSYWLRAQW